VHVLLAVPGQQRQVQDKGDPVSVDKEEESQETVNGGLGDDVGVEAVAEVNGVDVIAGAKLECVVLTGWQPRVTARKAARAVGEVASDKRELTIPDRCT
jgi:hypothetical protein